jgi:hypothetical protein
MNGILKTAILGWLRLRWRLKRMWPPRAAAAPVWLRLKGEALDLPFIRGANLPWLSYGGDFGANAWNRDGGVARPEKVEKLRSVFRELSRNECRVVRWFLFCDGRAGIRFTRAGTPVAADHCLFADIDSALAIAAEFDLRLIFVLFDFLWFGAAAMVNGVQVGGRGKIISGKYRQSALRRRVLKPLFKRYGASPVILAWDIINEPEWVTGGFDETVPGRTVSILTLRRFIRKTARLIRRHTRQLATVGLGNAAGLPLVMNTGLDFYQVHWYDKWEAKAPLHKPAAAWNIDRPLLLGEFPTRNSQRTPQAIMAAAEKSGYCGALAWSVLGTDPFSGMGGA